MLGIVVKYLVFYILLPEKQGMLGTVVQKHFNYFFDVVSLYRETLDLLSYSHYREYISSIKWSRTKIAVKTYAKILFWQKSKNDPTKQIIHLVLVLWQNCVLR